ncbi:peptidase 1 [Earliella scabrosa]|nr:peptidase 1 [Earliella scabrosa]
MLFTARLAALALAFVGAVQASPMVNLASTTGRAKPNSYIVSLKPNAQRNVHRSILSSFALSESEVAYEWPELNAFSGTFSEDALQALRESGEVAAIEPDTVGNADALTTQTGTIWNLQRISQLEKLATDDEYSTIYNYTYDDSAGAGVDVYVIDSGISISHKEFEGRASWGNTFGGDWPETDGLGHGTHVAATVAGKTFGVAKKANVIAVRVLDDDGFGNLSDCIAAVQWVIEQVTTVTHRPSVMTLSLRYDPSDILDAAVTQAIDMGIHVTASAGNANRWSSSQSPARAEAIITVGASDIFDARAIFSNFGPGVDIYAPGANIRSAFIGGPSDNAEMVMSGTSMATPHVAGLVAYLIALEGDKHPHEILTRIKEFGPDGILLDIPADTNNELINNGATL